MTEHDKDDALAAFEQDLNHALGNAHRIIHETTEHVPVPSGHAPRLDTLAFSGEQTITIVERDGGIDSGAWIECGNPVDTREWL